MRSSHFRKLRQICELLESVIHVYRHLDLDWCHLINFEITLHCHALIWDHIFGLVLIKLNLVIFDIFILRNILYKHVPKNLIERPKAGFSIPLGDWLRGPLKEWVETLINHTRLKEEGFLDADHVQIIWQEHLSKRRNWTIKLWSILMFQSWLESTSN